MRSDHLIIELSLRDLLLTTGIQGLFRISWLTRDILRPPRRACRVEPLPYVGWQRAHMVAFWRLADPCQRCSPPALVVQPDAVSVGLLGVKLIRADDVVDFVPLARGIVCCDAGPEARDLQ